MGCQSSMLKMEEKVHHGLKTRALLHRGDRIVVAVSGGPDSVALLACLVSLSSRWNWGLSIGHVNHGLRGSESEGDAEFVRWLGKKFSVPVCVHEGKVTRSDAKSANSSLQSYARKIRYDALVSMLCEQNATKIVTGHTADDQAETVLMWMLRGSGTAGLSGIPRKRGESVIRPFLDISRGEVLAYLASRKLSYRIDSSNERPVYLRNRLRNDLMPHLKSYSPGIVKILSRQAEILHEDHTYLDQMAEAAFRQACLLRDERRIQLDRLAVLAMPIAIRRRVVRQSLQEMLGQTQGPRFDIVDMVLRRLEHGQSGWRIHVDHIDITQEYDCLNISIREERNSGVLPGNDMHEVTITIPGEVVWPLTGQRIILSTLQNSGENRNCLPSEASTMDLDASTFTPQLVLRIWRPGDVFCPKGLGGRLKKLQDFFSDIKLPRSQRSNVPLLTAPEGILWVGGLRGDERFQRSPTTTSVIRAMMIS